MNPQFGPFLCRDSFKSQRRHEFDVIVLKLQNHLKKHADIE